MCIAVEGEGEATAGRCTAGQLARICVREQASQARSLCSAGRSGVIPPSRPALPIKHTENNPIDRKLVVVLPAVLVKACVKPCLRDPKHQPTWTSITRPLASLLKPVHVSG